VTQAACPLCFIDSSSKLAIDPFSVIVFNQKATPRHAALTCKKSWEKVVENGFLLKPFRLCQRTNIYEIERTSKRPRSTQGDAAVYARAGRAACCNHHRATAEA
jgi:hypothetical protein